MSAHRDAPSEEHDGETIQGLWRALLGYVPKRKQSEAWALANVLHHFIGLAPEEALRDARREGFQAGYEAGQKAEEDRARELARLTPARPDGPKTLDEEMRANLVSDSEPTKH